MDSDTGATRRERSRSPAPRIAGPARFVISVAFDEFMSSMVASPSTTFAEIATFCQASLFLCSGPTALSYQGALWPPEACLALAGVGAGDVVRLVRTESQEYPLMQRSSGSSTRRSGTRSRAAAAVWDVESALGLRQPLWSDSP